ncbi:hypothetical protein SAMN04488696_0881 [Methanolobus profundi]|uniref:Uncharacterized protein n=1 Tax=Methanolobus profundi TaxID=487685 RepID=A0A1I4PUE2_9EURY|nr:hypothetical protein SAMN04488696_0881 [Methanolobus profundi]
MNYRLLKGVVYLSFIVEFIGLYWLRNTMMIV